MNYWNILSGLDTSGLYNMNPVAGHPTAKQSVDIARILHTQDTQATLPRPPLMPDSSAKRPLKEAGKNLAINANFCQLIEYLPLKKGKKDTRRKISRNQCHANVYHCDGKRYMNQKITLYWSTGPS